MNKSSRSLLRVNSSRDDYLIILISDKCRSLNDELSSRFKIKRVCCLRHQLINSRDKISARQRTRKMILQGSIHSLVGQTQIAWKQRLSELSVASSGWNCSDTRQGRAQRVPSSSVAERKVSDRAALFHCAIGFDV